MRAAEPPPAPGSRCRCWDRPSRSAPRSGWTRWPRPASWRLASRRHAAGAGPLAVHCHLDRRIVERLPELQVAQRRDLLQLLPNLLGVRLVVGQVRPADGDLDRRRRAEAHDLVDDVGRLERELDPAHVLRRPPRRQTSSSRAVSRAAIARAIAAARAAAPPSVRPLRRRCPASGPRAGPPLPARASTDRWC